MPDLSIQHLAQRIWQTRPIDRAAKLALAGELQEARGRLYPSAGQDAVDRLEAAAMLMTFLAGAGEVPIEALQTVARLTASLDDKYFAPAAPTQLSRGISTAFTPRPNAPEVKLEVRDSSTRGPLLGELMIEQGFINREQLNQVLLLQRASGLSLGESLAESGWVTREQVRQVLQLQERLRR